MIRKIFLTTVVAIILTGCVSIPTKPEGNTSTNNNVSAPVNKSSSGGLMESVSTTFSAGIDKVKQSIPKARSGSKYQPSFKTSSDVDNLVKVINEVNGKVVTDELGSYFYHTVNSDLTNMAYLNTMEDQSLRSLFKDSVGLLMPIYSWTVNRNGGFGLAVDWPATERRHAVFSKNLKLNILQMSATRKYHEILTQHSTNVGVRPGQELSAMGVIFEKTGLSADYLIISDGFQHYMLNINTHLSGDDFSWDRKYLQYLQDETSGGGDGAMQFTSIDLIKQAGPTGRHSFSRCGALNFPKLKKFVERAQSQSFLGVRLPGVTKLKKEPNSIEALRSATAEAKEDDLKILQAHFRAVVKNQPSLQIQSEAACLMSLAAFKVSGGFSSKKLK